MRELRRANGLGEFAKAGRKSRAKARRRSSGPIAKAIRRMGGMLGGI